MTSFYKLDDNSELDNVNEMINSDYQHEIKSCDFSDKLNLHPVSDLAELASDSLNEKFLNVLNEIWESVPSPIVQKVPAEQIIADEQPKTIQVCDSPDSNLPLTYSTLTNIIPESTISINDGTDLYTENVVEEIDLDSEFNSNVLLSDNVNIHLSTQLDNDTACDHTPFFENENLGLETDYNIATNSNNITCTLIPLSLVTEEQIQHIINFSRINQGGANTNFNFNQNPVNKNTIPIIENRKETIFKTVAKTKMKDRKVKEKKTVTDNTVLDVLVPISAKELMTFETDVNSENDTLKKERNKLAAQKYRQKQKRMFSDLEQKLTSLKQHNLALANEDNRVRQYVGSLQEQYLLHKTLGYDLA